VNGTGINRKRITDATLRIKNHFMNLKTFWIIIFQMDLGTLC
jgi:hypothetical protein